MKAFTWQCISMSYNWGATARANVQGVVSRSRERLNRLRSNLVQRWGPVRRVECKSQLGPTLPMRTCSMTVPDLKNNWADCMQIWCTDRDQLVGCPASQFFIYFLFSRGSWKHTHTVPHVQGSTSCSLICHPKRHLTGMYGYTYCAGHSLEVAQVTDRNWPFTHVYLWVLNYSTELELLGINVSNVL